MSTMVEEGNPRPLEEIDPELAEFFRKIVNKEVPLVLHNTDIYFRRQDGKLSKIVFPAESVGRNDPCPYCLQEGRIVKWKKCSIHKT